MIPYNTFGLFKRKMLLVVFELALALPSSPSRVLSAVVTLSFVSLSLFSSIITMLHSLIKQSVVIASSKSSVAIFYLLLMHMML